MRPKDCPSENDLRTYLQRDGQTNQSAIIETHLVTCRPCRLDLLNWQQQTAGLVEQVSVPPKLKRRVTAMGTAARTSFFSHLTGWAGSPLYAVAALVLIAVTAAGLWRYMNNAAPASVNNDPLRVQNRRTTSISPIFPSENAVIHTPTFVFSWTTDTEVIRYTVLVLEESGDIVYQAVTTSSQVTVDISQTQLQPQKKYFWYVRAKLADGTELETKPRAFYVQVK